MNRKFLSLAPLLAIVAFAVMPAAAQAAPHFYSNHVILGEETGGPGEEGKDIIAWSKLTLETKTVGTIVCENEFGGDAYNPPAAAAGEAKVDAYAVYDCTNESCEVALNSKQEIVPEGLNKFGEWESKLTEAEAGVPRLKVGNATPNSPTAIKFLISCPPNGLGEIKVKSEGELTPKVKNGTLIGSAPSKIEFGEGSGELNISGVKEGKVAGSLKVMGYAAGEILSTSNP